jgi:hypothetical protein
LTVGEADDAVPADQAWGAGWLFNRTALVLPTTEPPRRRRSRGDGGRRGGYAPDVHDPLEQNLVASDEQEAFLADTELNGPFVADLLSDVLAHERCGAQLYCSVTDRTNNPRLERSYEQAEERFGWASEARSKIITAQATASGSGSSDRACVAW